MNDDAMKWITELEKAARIRTPVGAGYAVALALMHVASSIEKLAAKEMPPAAYDVRTTTAGGKK